MRRSVIAAAVTTCVVAAASRRTERGPRRSRTSPDPNADLRSARRDPDQVDPGPIPTQRAKTELEQLVDGDAELVLAEQDAQDAHILAALDQLVAGPHRGL